MAEGALRYHCLRCGMWTVENSRLRCWTCGPHTQMVPVRVRLHDSGHILVTVDEALARQQGLMPAGTD